MLSMIMVDCLGTVNCHQQTAFVDMPEGIPLRSGAIFIIKLMKGKAIRKHEKIDASVLLKLFISCNE